MGRLCCLYIQNEVPRQAMNGRDRRRGQHNINLGSASTVEDRAKLTRTGDTLGIPAAESRRFFDQIKQMEPALIARLEANQANSTGSPEQQRAQFQTVLRSELSRLAAETLGGQRADARPEDV